MKVTEREFRIAAVASVFGFFCCYFLVGGPTPPREAWKMTVIYHPTNAPAALKESPGGEFRFELNRTNAGSARFLPAFVIKERPELLGQPPRARVDLFSSRYGVQVDLSDLQ